METRIYEVKNATGSRLIEAATPAQALRHVTDPQFTVSVAGAKRIAELMTAGSVKVEKAGEASCDQP